jgi:hypothetical protein
MLLNKGVIKELMSGKTMGRFVVSTATNVSRTAQEPAVWAAPIGSFIIAKLSAGWHNKSY